MSIFSIPLLIASVFAIDSYPPSITAMLQDHFEEELKQPFILSPLCTNGATRTHYYLLAVEGDRYFVKYGEKVNLEVANQLRLPSTLPIPPLGPGTSLEKKILVRYFLTRPNFGFELVNSLYTSNLELEAFLEIQASIFERAFIIYDNPTPVQAPSKFFSQRVKERLLAMVNDPNLDSLLAYAMLPNEISNRRLFSYPILYESKTHESVFLPSINEMVNTFIYKFSKVPEIGARYRIHGDMHPPNIAYHDSLGIVFIDLSDICDSEDPCWDLGKWMNHVKRLHPVVQKRSLRQEDNEICITFSKNYIELHDSTCYPIGIDLIGKFGIKQYAKFLQEEESLIDIRSKAAEFVTNINTLKRHIELFPLMTKRLLCLIAESYLEWTYAADAYYVQESP